MSKTMCDASGNPLSVGMAVLWRPSDDRSFRPGWVRDVSDFAGAPAARIDDGAEWDTDRTGRTWSVTEWIADPKQIRPREQPAPDPRLATLADDLARATKRADEATDLLVERDRALAELARLKAVMGRIIRALRRSPRDPEIYLSGEDSPGKRSGTIGSGADMACLDCGQCLPNCICPDEAPHG